VFVSELAGLAVQDEEAGLIAMRSRGLGDEFVGEVEVEIGCQHGGNGR
jgi:hypothetical protein